LEKLEGVIMGNKRKGMTLIELIVALFILSIVIMMGYSMSIFGIRNFSNQSSAVNNQSNIRYAMSYISKEIRKAESITVSDNKIKVNNTTEYKLEGNIIKKNTNNFVQGIGSFVVVQGGKKITISIISLPDSNGQTTTMSAEIYIRE
jgi:prepilin-type N-terminal cleavage/methylation domain-containing protein